MKYKNIISMGMVAALLISTTSIVTSYASQNNLNNATTTLNQETAEINSKSEVVYAKLSATGIANGIYVVNHFEVEKSGSITDYGNYISVQNLTETTPITQNGSTLSIQVEEGDFYYQGNMESTDLPWLYEITYELDGVIMSPEELAGKSGELIITIKTTQNTSVDSSFFENYLQQISITLDTKKSSNIIAPDATVAEAGNNTMLAFTVLPNKNADLKVTAQVNDFAMGGIEISAMPFSQSIDLPDTDSMLEDFEKLPKAIHELNEGVGKLAEGTSELKDGADQLKDGSSDFNNGLTELKKNSSQITAGSAQINDALAQISTSLNNNSSGIDLSSLTQLPTALTEMSNGIKGISSGLNELKAGYSSAYTALDATIQNIPDVAITEDQINKEFVNANETQRKLLNQLYGSYVAGQTVKGTYNQVKLAFDSIQPSIENITGNLDTIAGGLDEISSNINNSLSSMDMTEQLGQLTSGLNELANNYSVFNKGLLEYMNGVGKLADGYKQFDIGVSEFANGVGDLDGGVTELHDGTEVLDKEISKMPDKMQEEVDNLMADFDVSDFEAISFVSPENKNTGLVQFVLKCDDIKVPDEDKTEVGTMEDTKKDETVIDRLISLFKKDE